ncbi:DsbA family protein [Paraflavitalea soli]|nr:DsbA family protein [Paraflavitalea soli]
MKPHQNLSKKKAMEERKRNDPIQATWFTDPLCCWSWGMQPHLDQWQAGYGDQLTLQYVMGGMLPSWQQFHDEANNVSRPVQMGPVWMHAAQLMGRPVHHQVWMKDPPASSYPACIAVKAAALQLPEAGITLFRNLQQALMAAGKNIASWPILQSLAAQLVAEYPAFDLRQFEADYKQDAAIDAFKQDLARVAQYRITRFPTLLIEIPGQKGILLAGYRTGEGIMQAVEQAFPNLV